MTQYVPDTIGTFEINGYWMEANGIKMGWFELEGRWSSFAHLKEVGLRGASVVVVG